jgi:Fic family protein
MDLDALRDSPVGRLVPITGTDGRRGEIYAYEAFLPDPLPRMVELRSATWQRVIEAETALARLDEAARKIPEPALLRQPSLRREAQSTSALEGTFAPLQDVLESAVEERASSRVEVREVLNYVAAAEEAFDWVRERPLTRGMIESLQGILVLDTPSQRADAGRLREVQVFIGPRDTEIRDARFVPPPPGDQLRAGIDDWVSWVNTPPPGLPAVVHAALAHYQFETLHPFSDGNGRLGRLIIVLQLMRRKILEQPILVVSPWFEARRQEYQDALLAVSQTGRWGDWVEFFAAGVASSADTTRERINALLDWQDETLRRVRSVGVTGVAERLVGELIGTPVLRASQVSDRHDVTPQGAMNALRRLVDLDVLRESRRPNGRVVFVAEEVVQMISRWGSTG